MKNKKLQFPVSVRKGKTPLMQSIQKAFRLALKSSQKNDMRTDEILQLYEEQNNSRRKFLKQSVTGLAGLAFGSALLQSCAKEDDLTTNAADSDELFYDRNGVKIIIVGGGMAGLNCAFKLKNAGYHAHIYEASTRSGGRIFLEDIIAVGPDGVEKKLTSVTIKIKG